MAVDARHQVKSLKKALRVLAFMNQRGDATVSQVATAVGLPRPTAYRIMETLACEGYLEKLPHSVFYRITSLVQALAAGFQDEELLLEVAKPRISALGQELGWPITLYTPRGIHMVVRLNTDHDSALALERWSVGYSVPILDATSGYCYLANCPAVEREELLGAVLRAEAFTTAGDGPDAMRYLTVTDNHSHLTRFNQTRTEEIAYLIKLVRERGFCNIEFKRYPEGNVGVPLMLGGKPVGGLVMRYIKSVMRNTDRIQSYYVPRLQKLAQEITEAQSALAALPQRPARVQRRSAEIVDLRAEAEARRADAA
jgi:IclR family mhp operon transcriptional activator